jgi:type II secretory pathway predicted ATPase ExeA
LISLPKAKARWSVSTLESLRLLPNLETEKRKLLQIILFGQPELDEKLAAPSARQLLQRIVFHHDIAPMPKSELQAYLDHRMQVAGHRGTSVFLPAATRLIHRHSGGTPRLVNVLRCGLPSNYAIHGASCSRRYPGRQTGPLVVAIRLLRNT